MFSQTAEYALRIVVYLASLKGAPATIRQIAGVTKVPEGYLAKVLQSLSRARILSSQRGLHGGSTLSRPAEQLSVYDVLDAVSPLPRITTCPLGLKSHGVNLCPLHRRMDDAMASVERAFRDSTIADLLAEPTTSTPLCEGPVAREVVFEDGEKSPAKGAIVPLTTPRRRRNGNR
jgi:Rrf2 family transcriptional regulator, nitric oxide-sensitive transcriptional repressor